jgi:hypothetical protein
VRAVAAAYDFSRVGTVVDVAAVEGALAIGLLEAYAHLRGIVFDQPAVVADAREAIAVAGLADPGVSWVTWHRTSRPHTATFSARDRRRAGGASDRRASLRLRLTRYVCDSLALMW